MECGGDQEFMVEMALSSPGQQEVVAAAVTTSPTAAPAAAAATTRPYYECVFCKRGFTTAQALGGHMNIHRRHRHRAKPPGRRDMPTTTGITSTVSRDVECYSQHRYLAYPPPPTPAPSPVTSPPMSSSFATYYAGGTATVDGEAMSAAGSSTSHIRELSLLGGAETRDHDLHLRLGRHGRGGDGSPRTPPEGSPERKLDLDLELRLGRRPRH